MALCYPILCIYITTFELSKGKFEEFSPEERNVLSVIMWSDEQQELLDNDPIKLITWSDFGTGKASTHHYFMYFMFFYFMYIDNNFRTFEGEV